MTDPETILIRSAATDDVAALTEIERLCFEKGYSDKLMSAEDFSNSISGDLDEVIVAEDQGDLAGYALLLTHPDRREADFDSLAVAPCHQGKGIGEILFKAVEAHCSQHGIPRLNLEIREDNYVLLKHYHRFGYKCFTVEEGFYEDGAGAIRMYKLFS